MEVVDGVRGLIDLFDTHPIVALGELHGIEQSARFVEDLVRDPRFAARPTAIVVEFGTARYQAICDAYVVAGDDVPLAELRRIWCDVTGGGPWGCRAPIYPQFFAAVRAVNRALPVERRIRVLCGDLPIDWSRYHTMADLRLACRDRDEHVARVVVEAWRQHGRRVLVLAGTYHLMKRHPPMPFVTVVDHLERAHPGATFVIHPHFDLAEGAKAEIEAKLAAWPVPALAHLAETWLGGLPAATFFGWQLIGADGQPVSPFAASELRLRDLVDGLLYLGPLASYTWSKADYRPVDDADRVELRRRAELWGDPHLMIEELAALDDETVDGEAFTPGSPGSP